MSNTFIIIIICIIIRLNAITLKKITTRDVKKTPALLKSDYISIHVILLLVFDAQNNNNKLTTTTTIII